MDRKQKKEFLIIAVGLLVLLSCMSFLLRSCSNQKAKQAQQRISTQQKIKQDKKEESTEKAEHHPSVHWYRAYRRYHRGSGAWICSSEISKSVSG